MNASRQPLDRKWFDNQKKAEKWARAFDYARALSNLPPLRVEPDGDGWAVVAPSEPAPPPS